MTELAHRTDAALAEMLPGARPLGLRVKPLIRLGMGVRDEQRGFPIATDYFTVRGDDEAVARFYQVYGEKPNAVDILLPSTLDMALRIEYLAFKGGPEGGDLIARGETNFAHREHAGGPDLLTVWNKDGTVVQGVETAGLDAITRQPLDQMAADLGIELHTTLRAMMPAVLDFGSFFEITTKGKESTDNLWAKLRLFYGFFGGSVSIAVKPRLVLRESTMRPVIERDGETSRIRKQTWVLDLVSPETLDEMFVRLHERGSMLTGHHAVAELPAATSLGSDAATPTTEGVDDPHAASEPEELTYEVGDDGQASLVTDGEPEQQQPAQPQQQPSNERSRLLAELGKALAEKETNGQPPVLIAEGGEELTFEGKDRWTAYSKAYCQINFGVGARSGLTNAQLNTLVEHLLGLDEIPF